MRDPRRIKKMLGLIEKIWKAHPDLRLGQLIFTAIPMAKIYYIEDPDLQKLLKETFLKKEN